MSAEQIIRAWKDEQYRASLDATQLASLPTNPAGLLEMTDEVLEDILAGADQSGSCLCCSC